MPSNYRNKEGQDPFADDQGRNPFADDGQEVDPAENQGPYSASDAQQYAYRPGDFETILPHRGRLVFGLGIVGLLVATAGVPAWYFWSAPILGALAFAATLPASVFAVVDLRAMGMGAVDPSGYRTTLWGGILGLLGSAVAAGNGILFAGQFIFWIRSSTV